MLQTNTSKHSGNQNNPLKDDFEFDFNFFENFKEDVLEQVVFYQDIRNASLILNKIKPFFEHHQDILQRKNQKFYKEWEDIFIKLEWIMLHTLREQRILDLMEHNFVAIYSIPNYDLLQKFKARMLWKALDERDSFKKEVQEALLRNAQILTQEGVVVGTHEKKGTIRNWLRDYNAKLGTGVIDNVKFSNYITSSQNTAGILEDSKYKIVMLFKFYEYLKHSSISLTGAEEHIAFVDQRDGKLKVFADGEIVEAENNKRIEAAFSLLTGDKSQDLKSVFPTQPVRDASFGEAGGPNPILAAFNDLPIPLDQIQAKMAELQARVSTQPKILEQILQNPGKVREKAFVVAALLLQIQNSKFKMTI